MKVPDDWHECDKCEQHTPCEQLKLVDAENLELITDPEPSVLWDDSKQLWCKDCRSEHL